MTVLEVTGHAGIPDEVFAGALSSLPNLEHLNLRSAFTFLLLSPSHGTCTGVAPSWDPTQRKRLDPAPNISHFST